VPFNPDRVKYDEYGAALLAVAGPLSNLALAFIGAVFLQAIAPGTFMSDVLQVFLLINVGLFVFNMIPIPPLDGSRVLYAFAPDSLRRIMETIEPFGFFIIMGLVLIGGFGSFIVNLNEIVLNFLL
jgi:Zn-dependent protease